MITPAPGISPGTTPGPGRKADDATPRGGVLRSVSATLAAALLLPLGACSSHSFSEEASVTEVIDFRNPGEFHTLIVDSKVGDIAVVGREGASGITAEIVKVGRGASPEKARESLERIEIVMAPLADNPGAFLCTSEFPEKWSGHSHKVEWRITAPTSMALDLLSDVGDIEAERFNSGARVRSDVGDVSLIDILGGVDVRSDVGDIDISAGGRVIARSDVGDVNLTIIDTGYADSHPIDIRSDVGDVELLLPAHFMGLIDAETNVGDVDMDLDEADAFSILSRSRSGKSMRIELNGVDEPAHELRTEVGDIEVEFYRKKR